MQSLTNLMSVTANLKSMTADQMSMTANQMSMTASLMFMFSSLTLSQALDQNLLLSDQDLKYSTTALMKA